MHLFSRLLFSALAVTSMNQSVQSASSVATFDLTEKASYEDKLSRGILHIAKKNMRDAPQFSAPHWTKNAQEILYQKMAHEEGILHFLQINTLGDLHTILAISCFNRSKASGSVLAELYLDYLNSDDLYYEGSEYRPFEVEELQTIPHGIYDAHEVFIQEKFEELQIRENNLNSSILF